MDRHAGGQLARYHPATRLAGHGRYGVMTDAVDAVDADLGHRSGTAGPLVAGEDLCIVSGSVCIWRAEVQLSYRAAGSIPRLTVGSPAPQGIHGRPNMSDPFADLPVSTLVDHYRADQIRSMVSHAP